MEEIEKNFNEFQSQTCEEAVVILCDYIPLKIVNLDTYYNEAYSKGIEMNEQPDEIEKIKDRLKIELEEFIEIVGMLRIWAASSIPKMDEMSYRSDVQKQVFGELKVAKSFGYLVLNKLTHHISHKITLRKQARKKPYIGDFAEAITAQNMEEVMKLVKWIGDLRNIYFIIYDIFTKNKEELLYNNNNNNNTEKGSRRKDEVVEHQSSFSEIL